MSGSVLAEAALASEPTQTDPDMEPASECAFVGHGEDAKEAAPPRDSQETMGVTSPQTEDQADKVWGKLVPASSDAPLAKVIELSRALTVLGRDKACTAEIPSNCVSSRHCTLHWNAEEGVATLEDHSSNGTWVNKKKVHRRRSVVSHADEIMLVPPSKRKARKKVSYTLFVQDSVQHRHSAFDQKYSVMKELGAGAFARVLLAACRESGDQVAVKCINKAQWARMKKATKRTISLLDEVRIMQRALHPHIVRVHEFFEEKEEVKVIMDFCGGGDMLEYLQANSEYPEAEAKRVFMQLVDAIDYLHGLNYAHRDLKPDNILLVDKESKQVKISDFGISRPASESMVCKTIIGTPMYQAPEVSQQRQQRNGYDGKLADYWSLGIILFIMLVAAPPGKEPQQVVEMVRSRNLNFYGTPMSRAAKDMVYALLQPDPKERITAEGIRRHAWIAGEEKEEASSAVANGACGSVSESDTSTHGADEKDEVMREMSEEREQMAEDSEVHAEQANGVTSAGKGSRKRKIEEVSTCAEPVSKTEPPAKRSKSQDTEGMHKEGKEREEEEEMPAMVPLDSGMDTEIDFS